MAAMLAMMAVATVSSMIGSGAASAAQRRALQEKQYHARVKKSFNEEKLKTDLKKVDMDFQNRFIQRLEGYTEVRNVQLVTVGYQGRAIESLAGVNAADDANFAYDDKVDELNHEMATISTELNNTYSNMGIDREIESADNAITASRRAQQWSNISAVSGFASSAAQMDVKMGEKQTDGSIKGGMTGWGYGGNNG